MAAKKKKAAPKKKKKAAAHRHAAQNEGAAKLSTRPIWQGHLRLSLVSCPVALFTATSRSSDISFHLLNPETNNRIRMVPTDPDTGPVERGDLVKGYEVSKNNYVVVTPKELEAVKLETTHTMEIERFVDADDIDRLFWNQPYYMVPNDDSGVDAYVVIRDALRETGRIALGRVVMHTRERLGALEPRDKGNVAYTLRMRNEGAGAKNAFRDIPDAHPSKQMVEIATRIIEQQEGPFDPDKFQDRYEKALKELIARKEKGEKIVTAEPVEDTNVIDLMAALKKSLKHKGRAEETEKRVKKRAKR